MGTSVYTGTALSGLVELPAVLLIYPAIESRGRRTGVIAFLALAGTFCLGWALIAHLYCGDKRQYTADVLQDQDHARVHDYITGVEWKAVHRSSL